MSTTQHTRRAYSRLARFYDLHDWLMEKLFYARWRQQLWRQVQGKNIVEVGIGTGKNMPYYPDGANIIAFDLVPAMLKQAVERNTHQTPLLVADAQQQPFADRSFDTVVATLVF